jgi:hypothetical protein
MNAGLERFWYSSDGIQDRRGSGNLQKRSKIGEVQVIFRRGPRWERFR